MSTRATRKEDVPDRHDLFGFGGNSLEAEPSADDALVHCTALRERRFLAMVGDRNAERARILERRAHEMRADDRLAVIAHGDGAGRNHLTDLGERVAALTDGDRAN